MIADASLDPELPDPAGVLRPTPLFWIFQALPLFFLALGTISFVRGDVNLLFLALYLLVVALTALRSVYTVVSLTVTRHAVHWRTLFSRGSVSLDELVDARASYFLQSVRLRCRGDRTLWLPMSPGTLALLEHLDSLRPAGLTVRRRFWISLSNLPLHTYKRLRAG
ncbi:hypothetical protein [Hamadaea tsunoensis]|uniref:hypothetical protein n=1 Tax=Hamadaea tsunoensis TaxID=53368 RepID=UPI000406D655|nr:hypothetical protein [Hamadaea tsunoensis]